MKAIITVGVSASGKTTWAREYQKQNYLPNSWFVLSRDDIRYHMLDEKGLIDDYSLKGIPWKNWNWKWEKEVTDRWWNTVKEMSARGRPLIIADTNLNFDRYKQMIEKLKTFGYDNIETKIFEVDFEEAVRRDTERPNGVGYHIIAKQMAQFKLFMNEYEGWSPVCNPRGTPAVIVDIDGTLAHMNGARSPYEWDHVDKDEVDPMVAEVVRGLWKSGYSIIVVSGRDGVCEEKTKQWLATHDVPYNHFFIRAAGDMRKDTIVKKEIYDAHICANFNVKMVIDDRPVVCRMWRDIGLKVMQVGDPYIEF
jgi:predicted kinase